MHQYLASSLVALLGSRWKGAIRKLFGVLATTPLAAACGTVTFDFPGEAIGSDGGPIDAPVADAGVPSVPTCAAGETPCERECVDLRSDPLHCGACNTVCSGASPVCNAGECRSTCTGGLSACAGACVDLKSDAKHCGDCAVVCAGGACTRGACACVTGEVLCGKRCVDTLTDGNNCGVCGRGCPQSTVCSAGECT